MRLENLHAGSRRSEPLRRVVGVVQRTGEREGADHDRTDAETARNMGRPGVVTKKEFRASQKVQHLQRVCLPGHGERAVPNQVGKLSTESAICRAADNDGSKTAPLKEDAPNLTEPFDWPHASRVGSPWRKHHVFLAHWRSHGVARGFAPFRHALQSMNRRLRS